MATKEREAGVISPIIDYRYGLTRTTDRYEEVFCEIIGAPQATSVDAAKLSRMILYGSGRDFPVDQFYRDLLTAWSKYDDIRFAGARDEYGKRIDGVALIGIISTTRNDRSPTNSGPVTFVSIILP